MGQLFSFRLALLLVLLCTPVNADIASARVDETTATQAIIRYTAPDANPCTVEVSESASFSPLVHDVDPALFAGSNIDNRAESLSEERERSFLVGKRRAEQAASGRWYSRALQAWTAHYYRVTCGTDQVTGSFMTSNIVLGNTYNEPLPPAPNVTTSGFFSYSGQYAWPEFLNWNAGDVTARQETVIDPQTGMSLKRMTMPQDMGHYDDHTFQTSTAPAGVWANPNGVLADDSSYASYSGTGSDWLFIADPNLSFGDAKLESLAFSLKAWCSGACAGEDAKVQVCLTVNGVSCWPTSSNVQEMTLGKTAQPPTFTSFGAGVLSMHPWAPPGVPPLLSAEATKRSGQVNVDAAGNVTLGNGSTPFYPGWSAGSRITVAGSSCKITTVMNPQLLSIDVASCSPALSLPLNSVPYSAGNFGVMLRKKTASLDTINLQYAKYTLSVSAQLQWPSGGSPQICNMTAVQNTITGHWGYHCVVGNTPQVYWVDSTTGDANWLGILNTGSHGSPDGWGNQGCNNNSISLAGGGSSGPETYYCANSDETGKAILLKCTVTTTNQPSNFDKTCENITPASHGKDILSLIANFTSGYTPVFDPVQYNAVGIIAMQNGQLVLSDYRGYQDTTAWTIIFNPNLAGTAPGCVGDGKPGCVVAAHSSWAIAPCRWCTMHGVTYAGNSNSALEGGKYLGTSIGSPGGGNYTTAVLSGMSAIPSIPAGSAGCPSGSRGCDLVTVDGEPCNTQPAGPLGGHPAEPLNCPKNPAWNYLQDAAPGDVFSTLSGPLEYMRIIAKNDNQWLLERGVGSPGIVTPATPIQLSPQCMARTDNFSVGVSTWEWVWDFDKDPHGLNADGATIRVIYPYDHMVASPAGMVGGAAWYDPNIRGGYAILDGPGYGDPNKYASIGPDFAGALGLTPYNEIAQEHPSRPQYSASAADQKWFLDARPLSGPGPTIADVATPVSGQLYKFPSTTVDGDNLSLVGGSTAQQSAVNRKLQPTLMFCGAQPLIDVSSAAQGNTIGTDSASSYQYCIARKAGECRTGSARGEIYANCPYVNPRSRYSMTYGCNNVFSEAGLGNDLCVNNTGAYLDGLVQIGVPDTYDSQGALGRTLTHALTRYRLNNVNENVRTTPDGAWLLFEGLAFGTEYQILMGKMLPFPPADSRNRSTFMPLTIQLTPPSGADIDNAVIQFGYAENGTPEQFFCTSRRETCFANASTVGAVPFQFPSDGTDGTAVTVSGVSCASGCEIVIPAVPQRAVYYQVQYRDSANQVIRQTAIQVAFAP